MNANAKSRLAAYFSSAKLGIVTSLLVLTANLDGADIWVANTCSNAGGDGSIISPYATIQKGIEVASNGDHVIVRNGTYGGVGNSVIAV